eukprot:CAMPEP_0116912756 /NCGR_PEP_ID=MMETSP0467-20121206/16285_1 /TAXON_ID=283647 /ORGANISM="Mesodinium pulex, Strain SPMC105" /LENGTH=55 /DNA_ID=CAMNT_0004588815 /DNA_START=1010 /DNA_END=1177 /DNA_ORIENTATION=-
MTYDADMVQRVHDRQLPRYTERISEDYMSKVTQNVVVIFIDALSMDQVKLWMPLT